MTKSVVANKLVFRFLLGDVVNNLVDFGYCAVAKEHRLCVGVHSVDEYHTVVLFVGTCKFVFLNDLVLIILAECSTCDTVLCAAVHCLSVDVEFGLSVLNQPFVILKFLEIFY